jgi:hypothetical protein
LHIELGRGEQLRQRVALVEIRGLLDFTHELAGIGAPVR